MPACPLTGSISDEAVQLALPGHGLSQVAFAGEKLYWPAGHLLQVLFGKAPVTSPGLHILTLTVIMDAASASCEETAKMLQRC